MNLPTNSNFPQRIYSSDVAENFGIKRLQQRLTDIYGVIEPEKINCLTAFLIKQLTNSLELLTKPETDNISESSDIVLLGYCPNLPANFPDSAAMPLYLYGDKVSGAEDNREADRYSETEMTDCGIIIGRFYAFDRDSSQWRWRYLIAANQDLAINTFNFMYVCWETELKPLD